MTDFAKARTAMVDCQVRPSDVTKFPIIDALLKIERENFVPSTKKAVAYAGEHIALSDTRALLDARTFAKMLDAANIQPTEMVLDIGCGMGYSTAILAHLSEAVVGIDNDQDLVNAASENLTQSSTDNAITLLGNLSAGAKKHGPYDVIMLQGSVSTIPDSLIEQLNDTGRIVAIFSDGKYGVCRIGYKSHGKIDWRDAFDATAPMLEGFQTEETFTFA
ncbi:protein-L-isoaspartate O-methyltransferase [Amylibacter ulvae]|uniref:Protein-L-isoaspartate O-methyltransferase n=1 Tax=Paramylibacter ulvae TaxID=1651968 RepID=A0ABQ3D5V3_9RHOB|nr:protein-L-isoaspartate O-methyltransferase [Amylibacter ulvae]GHA60357.1 protein-L-isoaspartate O-methyltransferase [Amylibacter ulvae]